MTKGMKYPPFARPGTPQRMKTPVADSIAPVEEALPSIDEFLDDLPSIDDFLASDPPEISLETSPEEFIEYEEQPNDEDGWAAGEWQSFDWSSAASLNRNTSSAMDSSNAWSDSDWPEPAASQHASDHPTADEIADALTGIAHRIRSGELVIDNLQGTPPEAAMAAALAVLLRMRG
jgi:hypothetical protein